MVSEMFWDGSVPWGTSAPREAWGAMDENVEIGGFASRSLFTLRVGKAVTWSGKGGRMGGVRSWVEGSVEWFTLTLTRRPKESNDTRTDLIMREVERERKKQGVGGWWEEGEETRWRTREALEKLAQFIMQKRSVWVTQMSLRSSTSSTSRSLGIREAINLEGQMRGGLVRVRFAFWDLFALSLPLSLSFPAPLNDGTFSFCSLSELLPCSSSLEKSLRPNLAFRLRSDLKIEMIQRLYLSADVCRIRT